MAIVNSRMALAYFVLGVLALSMIVPAQVRAQSAAVDPAATQILKRMTDYLDTLKKFSLHTQNTIEDLLESGQRIDTDISANVIISRPNKLRAERKGELVDQLFYYDGKSLILYNPSDKVYGKESAPASIEKMLHFAIDSLGLIIPGADLVYRNAYPALMKNVTSARVIGKTIISGVKCDHLAFSRPDVDFQVWVADSKKPLPYKYVVTDKSTPALVSISTVVSDWNTAPAVADKSFTFKPPKGTMAIKFMPLTVSGFAVKD